MFYLHVNWPQTVWEVIVEKNPEGVTEYPPSTCKTLGLTTNKMATNQKGSCVDTWRVSSFYE